MEPKTNGNIVFSNSEHGQRVCPVILTACCLLLHLFSFSQSGFYVPKQGNVFFSGDTATIFSNVINNGKLGVDQKAVVNFKGALWENDPAALITDETNSTSGTGGWIRFMNYTAKQGLISGYNAATQTGASFPNLQIANPYGVQLYQSGAKVRHQLSFQRGLVYLNNNVFVVGDQGPGKITGYSNTGFFVTGTQPGGSLLLRENITSSDGLVVFPVGTKVGSYTPAAIQSKTTQGDNYYVTVFDGVKAGLFSGPDLNGVSVKKTWQAGKLLHPRSGEAELYLQHQLADEGEYFSKSRDRAYISQYLGVSWDVGTPQSAPAAGSLTSTQAFGTGGLNRRTFGATFNATSYFTKFSVHDSLLTNIIWGAYRLSRETVVVNWQTKPEINIRYFVVQRRLSNEGSFRSLTAANSKAVNGISLGYLNYTTNDANSYTGISYYRLQVFDYSGQSYYTNIVAVNGELGNKIALWPNPATDHFSVLANSPLATALVIYNELGQKLVEKEINNRNQTVVEVSGLRLPSGIYVVGILDKDGNVLDVTKLVIQK